MKKIFILIAALYLCSNVFSQGINFEHGTFAEVLAKAKKENKMVFMDCYTSWCGPCKMLAKKIFPQKEVGDYFNTHFVNFKVDMEKGEGVELKKRYKVKAFPTLLFMDSDGKVLHTKTGASDAAALIAEAKKAGDPSQRIAAIANKYEEGNREPALVASYIELLYKEYNHKKMQAVGTDYLSNLSTKDLLKKENFDILLRVGAKYNDRMYLFVKNNREQFVKLKDKVTVGKFLFKAHTQYLSQLAGADNTRELDAAVIIFKKEFPDERYSMMLDRYYSKHYLANKQLDKWFDFYERSAEEAMKKDKAEGVRTIISAVSQVVKNPIFQETKGAYKRAVKMTQKAVETDENYIASYYYLSRFYKTSGHKTKALKNINTFIEKSKAQAKDVKPAIYKLKKEIENM